MIMLCVLLLGYLIMLLSLSCSMLD